MLGNHKIASRGMPLTGCAGLTYSSNLSSMGVGKNIRKLREERGISALELAVAVNTSPSNISRIETDGQQPRIELLNRIAEKFGVTPDSLYRREVSNVSPIKTVGTSIPLLRYTDVPLWVNPDTRHEVEVKEHLLFHAGLALASVFGLNVEGDSMLPDFREGDEITVDMSIKPKPGDFVVALDGGQETTFRKFRVIRYDRDGQVIAELVPLNPNYPSITSDIFPITIVGTVIEHTRKLRQ